MKFIQRFLRLRIFRMAFTLGIAASALLAAAPSQATDCSVPAFAFYQSAIQAGWKFSCMGKGLMITDGTLIPKPTGDVVCVGKMGLFNGMVELFVSKPAGMTSSGIALLRGWAVEEWIETPMTATSRWGSDFRQRIVSQMVAADTKFSMGLRAIQLTKDNGNCAIALAEAL